MPSREAPRAYPTIVSLNPCTDAILAEVADPAQILAISSYSHDPASSSMGLSLARRYRATGGSVEEVAALRPDVVVSGNFISPATTSALAQLKLPLVQLPIARTVAESEAQVRQLARLSGHADRGEALVARIEAALAAARSSAPPIPAVVWQSGGIVPGDDALIADLLRRTGFANFSAARGLKQADFLSLETMLADPPQLIFVAGNARSDEDRLLAHPALAALKNTRHAALDPSLLWCGGLTIVRAVERLREIRGTLSGGPSTSSGRADIGSVAFSKTPLMLSLSKHMRSIGPKI